MRALSDAGADVFALPDADRMSRRSRLFRGAPSNLVGLRAETLAGALPSLPPRTVLFPCSDMWARAIAALPDESRRAYPASIAPLAALDILVDKGKFRETLERLDIPHPTTRNLSSVGDLERIADDVFQSSFLKPQHSQQFFARFGVKAFRVGSRAEALERFEMCAANGLEMMLQEYIPGPPTNHYFIDGFVDRNGVVRAMFARRRLRMSPPDFGNSTSMVSVPLMETGNASTTLDTLFAELAYRGIFSAEFKRDERSGVFNLI